MASPLLHSRNQSMASDKLSATTAGSFISPPSAVSPEAQFIAVSAASQIVTNDQDSRSDSWFDQHGIEPSGETALVGPAALKLVNNFLDQLLLNFLSVSKSTALSSLRPAVIDVLKPHLAKEAINGAEQELEEYLGSSEDEDLFDGGETAKSDWDLELVWKRTRLRCMVYSSLGDMEEEDEDMYAEQENLDGPRLEDGAGIVSPAVAIFLTSVLEFMGEQALIVAGQAAYERLRLRWEREEKEGTIMRSEIADRVVVEETDMEKVALDRTLGRLWRGWKKLIRIPGQAGVGSPIRDSLRSRGAVSRRTSIDTEMAEVDEGICQSLSSQVTEEQSPASIPLPMSENDIKEIEEPDFRMRNESEYGGPVSKSSAKLRPKSLFIFPTNTKYLPTPVSSTSNSPVSHPSFTRKRSMSMPSPVASTIVSSSKRQKAVEAEAADHVIHALQEGDQVGQSVRDNAEQPRPTVRHGDNARQIVSSSEHVATALSSRVVGITEVARHTENAGNTRPNDDDADFYDVDGEAEILTSSRISIGGRITPDQSAPISRHSSGRAHSVHSLRLVDVPSPRTRSRGSSFDASDYTVRPLSLPGNAMSQIYSADGIRLSSPIQRGMASSPIIRQGSAMSGRSFRNSAGESIKEVEEQVEILRGASVTPLTPPVKSPFRDADAVRGLALTSVIVNPMPSQEGHYVYDSAVTPLESRQMIQENMAHRTPSPSTRSLNNSGYESGVPPLTPLREMLELAEDTSDDTSDEGLEPTSRSMTENIRAMNALENKRAEAHAVVRNGNRYSPPRESGRPSKGDTSARTFGRTSTPDSATSHGSHKVKPIRTSEDSGQFPLADKGKSFEQLMKSDQTIQYTLTPRAIEVPEPYRARTASLAASPKSASNQGNATRAPTSQSGNVNKGSGTDQRSVSDLAAVMVHARPYNYSRRPSETGPNPNISPQALARPARVEPGSTGDIADFLRSTGPMSMGNIQGTPATAATTIRHNAVAPRLANTSALRVAAGTSPKRGDSTAKRNRLQAREALIPFGDTSSDLIDFIRQGPPRDPMSDGHRIPRTVAPFRSTMDSDQMSGAVNANAGGMESPDPRRSGTQDNGSNGFSGQSSFNSERALIAGNGAVKSPNSPPHDLKSSEDEMVMPKRKTRRVRDPYAIDDSDEEDMLAAPVVKKSNVRVEESLLDFLNSVPPPPPQATLPLILSNRSGTANTSVAKKASSTSLVSRFARKGSTAGITPIAKSNISSPAAVQSATQPHYTATVTASGLNGNGVVPRSMATNVTSNGQDGREASQVLRSATADLADFLRNTEPPKSKVATIPVPVPEQSGFARMFRRKKSVAAM